MTQCVGLRRTPRRPSRLPAPVKCYYFLPPSSEYLRSDVAPEKATHHPSLPSRSSGILPNMNHFYGSACFVLESEKKKEQKKNPPQACCSNAKAFQNTAETSSSSSSSSSVNKQVFKRWWLDINCVASFSP